MDEKAIKDKIRNIAQGYFSGDLYVDVNNIYHNLVNVYGMSNLSKDCFNIDIRIKAECEIYYNG
jgi:hypothetical protein